MAESVLKVRVSEKKLEQFSFNVFKKIGVPEDDCRVIAKMLVNTEKRGVVTHGLARLASWYARPVMAGNINGKAVVKVLSETASAASMDGDKGLGFVVGSKAMNLAMQKAKATGIGIVNVRNVGHFGAALNYPLIAAENDMIGFCMTNTPPWMAAPGTGTAAIGTNPMSFAAPAGDKADFLLDMSSTVVAAAKAHRLDIDIPEGWFIDKQGSSVTEHSKVKPGEASLLPLGGDPAHGSFKGYGLGIMIEILTAILSGTSCGLLHFGNADRSGFSSLFGAIDIESFLPLERFKKLMDEMIDTFENLPNKLPGVERLYVPGGHSAELARECEKLGIPLSEAVIQEHRDLAKDLDIETGY